MSTTLGRFWIAVVAGALASACGSPSEPEVPGELEFRSQHFVYHAFADDPEVCPGLLDRMERHFEVILAATGFPWPEGRVIHYYKYRDYHAIVDGHLCPNDRGACSRNSIVYSSEAFHPHELIHAYFAALGAPPPIFSEGLATVLACDYFESFETQFDWDDPVQSHSYEIGQRLLSELLPTYGWQAFLQLYAGPWQQYDRAEIERNFQAVYGLPIEQEWARAQAAPEPFQACSTIWECASPALEPGETAQLTGQCEDEGLRSLQIEEPQWLELSQTGNVLLHECAQDPSQLTGGAGTLLYHHDFAELRSGKYFLQGIDPGSLSSRRPEVGSMLGSDCEQLEPVPVAVPNPGTAWLFRPPSAPYALRLAPSQGARLTILAQDFGAFQVCSSCAAADCASFSDAAQIDASGEVVLRFAAGVPDARPQQLIVSAEELASAAP